MNIKNRIVKGLMNLPGIREPKQSEAEKLHNLRRGYLWTLQPRVKDIGLNIGTYFEAGDMPWIRVCRRVIKNRVLALGYRVTNPNEQFNQPSTVNYLTNLMKNPMGVYASDFYETYIDRMWDSFLICGDAFARVHYDEVFDNVPVGLEYLPFEWMTYHYDTDQWGLKYNDTRFENDEIIHFSEPGIRGEKWGSSLIDSLARYLTLQIYGLRFNKSIFENNGINPNAVLNYDINIKPEELERELIRLEKDRKENPNGTLIVQGAEYISTQSTNKEMQYIELENLVRDLTLSVYGVTPAEAGIIESGNLGGGTGESQKETVKANLSGWLKLFEGSHNKVFGRSGFEEIFKFKEIDLEDKEKRAIIEDKKLRNGSTFVNEVRAGYGLDPVSWGDVPLTYGATMNTLTPDDTAEKQYYRKALMIERLKKDY